MHVPLILWVAVAALIAGVWSWLGAPVPMPPSPLADGAKLHCVSYAPFRGAQSPLGTDTVIDPRQIDEDLARLAKVTECVRTYSVGHGLDQVPALAAKHGLKVLLGLWISNIPVNTEREIETAIALANRHREVVRAVVVGNEVLLRGDMSATDLVATLRRVKAAVPVPVTHAEIWEFWLRNRDIATAADFITIHILPYWEDFPVSAERAAGYVSAIRARIGETFPGKEILIGETGWPSEGRMREAARPSPANQARVLHEVLNAAKAGNFTVNVIEAFDQPWKRQLEGTVGGYWGLFDDRTREAKFVWGQPVSNHPYWMAQAGAGIAFAAIIFLAGWAARARKETTALRKWLMVTAMAATAGGLIGLALENAWIESFGVGGWVRSAAMIVVALIAPVLAAAALTRGAALPSFARLLGGVEGGAADRLARAAGWALILLCVLAVQSALGLAFNPRYKDFPYAPLAAPAVAFLVLAFAGEVSRQNGVAERLAAAVLALSAVYIAFNEGFANWQAQSFSAILIALALTLLKSAGVRRTG